MMNARPPACGDHKEPGKEEGPGPFLSVSVWLSDCRWSKTHHLALLCSPTRPVSFPKRSPASGPWPALCPLPGSKAKGFFLGPGLVSLFFFLLAAAQVCLKQGPRQGGLPDFAGQLRGCPGTLSAPSPHTLNLYYRWNPGSLPRMCVQSTPVSPMRRYARQGCFYPWEPSAGSGIEQAINEHLWKK